MIQLPNITESDFCFKCKLCCLLSVKEKELAPYFSKKEARLIDNKKLKKTKEGLLQAKVFKSKTKKDYYRCAFLDEKNHKCLIYEKRPIDCKTWPFVIGWDKNKKSIYLWVVNREFCPAVKNIKAIKNSEISNKVIKYLKKNDFFKEIKNKERYVWPYKNYQIKLKKIKNLIK